MSVDLKKAIGKGKGNNTIIWNFSRFYAQRAENHYEYEEFLFDEVNKSGMWIVSPRDVYIEPAGILSIKPKHSEELDKRFKITTIEGTTTEILNTTHRRIKVFLPISEDDIPQGLDNSILGDALKIAFRIRKMGADVAKWALETNANTEQAMEYIISSPVDEVLKERTKQEAVNMIQRQATKDMQGNPEIKPNNENQ